MFIKKNRQNVSNTIFFPIIDETQGTSNVHFSTVSNISSIALSLKILFLFQHLQDIFQEFFLNLQYYEYKSNIKKMECILSQLLSNT